MKRFRQAAVGWCGVFLAWAGTAAGDPAGSPSHSAAPLAGPLDFPAAVELALRQSPLLRQGMIQVDVRRLDERDGKAGYWPTVRLNADYLVDAPETVSEPFSLHLNTGDYNPVGAYFTSQACREIVRLAELTYLQAIADGLHQAAEMFLALSMLEQAQAIQAEQLDWARRHVAWWTNRMDQFGAPLESKVAEQELVSVQLEAEKTAIRQRQAKRNLAALLGFGADDPLPEVRTAQARSQVLEGFAAAAPDREKAENRALELKMLDIQLRLQKLGVKGAYAEYLPRPNFALRSSDPLSETQEQGLYFFAGLSVPIWDAGWRQRNVQRQKAVLEQRVLEKSTGQEAWRRRWIDACDQRELADAEAALADQRVRLAELNFSRQELAVASGREEWPALKIAQQQVAEARLKELDKTLAADSAALALRHLSRDLLDRYVVVSGLLDEALEPRSDPGDSNPKK